MNLELFFNLMNILFAFGSNNWLSVIIAILVFCYNIYTKIRKHNLLSLVIDNNKDVIVSYYRIEDGLYLLEPIQGEKEQVMCMNIFNKIKESI